MHDTDGHALAHAAVVVMHTYSNDVFPQCMTLMAMGLHMLQ